MNFDKFKEYDTIVVIGAQRSGTQIASKIIAAETGKDFIHENCFDVHDFDKMLTFIGGTVIHAPALSHMVSHIPPEVCVIFVVRNFRDIIKSQKRVGWNDEQNEKEKYFMEHDISTLDKRPICKIKHDVFFDKDHLLPNTEYILYSWFEGHNSFVKKEERKDFGTWQTEKT